MPRDILVDDSTYVWAKNKTWYVNHDGYAVTHLPRVGNTNAVFIQLHRAIMGEPDNMLVDHQDRNKLNCQEYNLRVCTKGENQRNSSYKRPGSTSKYRGVSWHASSGTWRAQISFNSTKIELGHYTKELDAAIAYNNGSTLYHKEFGVLNEI